MKKRSIAILMLFIFLNLSISYDVRGITLQDVILEKDDVQEAKFYEELIEVNELDSNLDYEKQGELEGSDYDKYFLELENIYDFLNEYCNTYTEDIHEVYDEVLKKNLDILREAINYLNKKDLEDLINEEIKEKIKFLDHIEFNNIDEIKNILEEIILYYKDTNLGNMESIFQETKEEYVIDNELDINIRDEDSYYKDAMYTEYISNLYEDEEVNESDEMLLASTLLQENTNSKIILNSEARETLEEDELKVREISTEDNGKDEENNYSLNISSLQVTKGSNEELKITFKIDNDLDLKNENNDLKVYIGNKNGNNTKILITKDKTLEKYLYLENVTSLSGEALKLGKDDTLLDGMYTVVLSDEEQEKLNGVGLENLVVKVEAIFNNKSSSLVGYLKDDIIEGSTTGVVEKKGSQEANSIMVNSNNEGDENSTKDVLPKTGTFLRNYLILVVGILSVLLGSFLIRYKKIGS